MDEVTPHIHFAFVPIVRDKKKDILKVSAKEAVNRYELQRFHGDLSGYMENIFGRDIGILNEATKEGNKAIDVLKRGTAQQELKEITAEIEEKTQEELKLGYNVQYLENKKKSLEDDISGLEKSYKGKKLAEQDIDKIKPTKWLGGVKNVTVEDIKNLKKLAIGNLRKETALEKAKQEVAESKEEIAELKKDNARLKKQVPTSLEKLAQNQQKIKITDLEKENTQLKSIINKLKSEINELPEQVQAIIMRIITPPPKEKGRKQANERD
jgi:predicted  nucleic acid-binding Zn-ribbon protein